jgi:hypothetical protein
MDYVYQKKPRKKLSDVKYTLYPDIDFVHDVIEANKRQREIKNQLPPAGG